MGSAVNYYKRASWAVAPGIASDGKQTWNSEFGGHETHWNGALDLALDMHTQLVWGHESAMIYWTFTNETVDVHSLLGHNQLSNPEQSKKYSTFKHFSRHISPGAKRVKATFEDGNATLEGSSALDADNALNVSAYVHDSDGSLTIVLVNMKDKNYDNVAILLPEAYGDTIYDVIQTDASQSFNVTTTATPENNEIVLQVPPSSVVTITEGGQITGVNSDRNNEVTRATVLPNPSDDLFQLITESEMHNVEVYHVTGQKPQMKKYNINSRSLIFGNQLGRGIFLVKIVYQDGLVEILKIRKD